MIVYVLTGSDGPLDVFLSLGDALAWPFETARLPYDAACAWSEARTPDGRRQWLIVHEGACYTVDERRVMGAGA